MKDFKSFFDYLSLALRYIIAGFVCLAVVLYIDPKTYNVDFFKSNITLIEKSSIMILFFAGLTGICIYAFHFAFLDKLFYSITIFAYGCFRKFSPSMKTDIREWNDLHYKTIFKRPFRQNENHYCPKEYLFTLVTQNYLRKISKNPQIKELQKQIESKLALMMFLYGCCYATLLLPYIYDFLFPNQIDGTKQGKLFWIGIVTFVITLRFDWRITLREIWVVFKYYQEPENEVTFTVVGHNDKSSVKIVSNFGKLNLQKENNYWILKTFLPKGDYLYQFDVDGTLQNDPLNANEKDGKSFLKVS
jgi:hypothetical protein